MTRAVRDGGERKVDAPTDSSREDERIKTFKEEGRIWSSSESPSKKEGEYEYWYHPHENRMTKKVQRRENMAVSKKA